MCVNAIPTIMELDEKKNSKLKTKDFPFNKFNIFI